MGGKVQKSSYRWTFSPLFFMAAAGLVALILTKGDPDYPHLLIGGVTGVMYIHPKWRELPNSFHNAVISASIITIILAVLWILHLFTIKRNKNI